MPHKSKKSAGDKHDKVVPTPECLKNEGYQLHEKLGEGAYSVVYRATNSKNEGVNYACKRYKIDKNTIKWVDRCLHREMTLVMKVRHPSIVEAFNAIRAGDEAFLILQYAPNGSIRDLLRKKLEPNVFLAEHKVRNWCADLFAAVAYLHSKEIAHRDIKTDNFILDLQNRPLLCDFSFALMSDKADTRFECMTDTVCGTTSYLAPEVHSLKRGQRYNAKLSDVYALGISLYEMLVKTVPFCGKWRLGDPELVKLQLAKDYSYPSKIRVSTECRNLIELLLEPNPNNRITINRALTNPWFEKAKTSKNRSKKSIASDSSSSESFRKQAVAELSKKKETKSIASAKSSKSSKSNRNNSKSKKASSSSKQTSAPKSSDDSKVDEDNEQE